eukprot:CAMPEP_0172860498 /NCGR_PEP_ID=MMETSP1075-20121228/72121_1 /TAXON_ID=2916 /ORGANISM="Ceratium fusus, Strain PA161109" /LENGTH=360 /DNA_ID=CAMNT_0013708533 /DNA_START=43 /DNA_END=1122 /DNA_ORIENTATION=+
MADFSSLAQQRCPSASSGRFGASLWESAQPGGPPGPEPTLRSEGSRDLRQHTDAWQVPVNEWAAYGRQLRTWIESQVNDHLTQTLSGLTAQQAAPLEEARREATAARAVAQRALDDLATLQEAQERLLATVWQHESLLQQLDARLDARHKDLPSQASPSFSMLRPTDQLAQQEALEVRLETKLEAKLQLQLEAKLRTSLEVWVQSVVKQHDAAIREAMRAEVTSAQGEVEERLMVHMTTLQGEIAGKLWDETCLDSRLEQTRRDLGQCIVDMQNSIVQDLSELGRRLKEQWREEMAGAFRGEAAALTALDQQLKDRVGKLAQGSSGVVSCEGSVYDLHVQAASRSFRKLGGEADLCHEPC